jgi:hypothetical protein
LGFALLHSTSHDEMTKNKKTKKQKKGLHLRTLLFLDIYRIQILQNIAQLSSKGDLINHPFF